MSNLFGTYTLPFDLFGTDSFYSFGVFSYLVFIVAIVVLAYGTTRYISTIYSKGVQSRNIKIIEKVNLAADKSLWLIELGEKAYFAYSDKNGMTLLDSVSTDGLQLKNEDTQKSFSTVFSQMIKKREKQEKL
jgi:flagellar biogenesis protein FliO